jgi:type II secretory pathway component PulJ
VSVGAGERAAGIGGATVSEEWMLAISAVFCVVMFVTVFFSVIAYRERGYRIAELKNAVKVMERDLETANEYRREWSNRANDNHKELADLRVRVERAQSILDGDDEEDESK